MKNKASEDGPKITKMTDYKKPSDAREKVQVKSNQIVDLLSSKIQARMECIKRIRGIFEDSYNRYYERHPQYAVDERGTDATEWSMNGLQSIINILGDYNITFRDGVQEVPLSIQVEEHKNGASSPVAVDDPITPTGGSHVA